MLGELRKGLVLFAANVWLVFCFPAGVWCQLQSQLNIICALPMRAAQRPVQNRVTQAWDIVPPCLQWCSQQNTGKMGASKPQRAGF